LWLSDTVGPHAAEDNQRARSVQRWSPCTWGSYQRTVAKVQDAQGKAFVKILQMSASGWWFQTFGLFSIISGIILSHWLSYFSRRLKPPTSHSIADIDTAAECAFVLGKVDRSGSKPRTGYAAAASRSLQAPMERWWPGSHAVVNSGLIYG
jgi:hypothetical protein